MTGLLSARRTLCSMAAAPVAGTLSDRLAGRWRVTGWATCAGVAGFLLMVWGASGAVAGVLVASAATGGMESLATALTGDLAGPRQRGRAIGLLHTAGDLGSAVGPAAAFALLPWLDLRGVYLACAGIMAVSLAPAMYFGVRERRVRHPSGSPPASS
ncbi:MAG TPA: MFS transporter [Anaerolineae bacterium]|nr:MFS transporter [Anaerolineae bacterium]